MPRSASRLIEQSKLSQYSHWSYPKESLVPFAIDIAGAFGPRMRAYLDEAASVHLLHCPWDVHARHNAEVNISRTVALARNHYLNACRRTFRGGSAVVSTTPPSSPGSTAQANSDRPSTPVALADGPDESFQAMTAVFSVSPVFG